MSAFKCFTEIKFLHSEGEGLLPECSIGNPEWRQLKFKHAWQFTSVCAATDHQRQVADRQYKFNMDGHDSG